MGNDPIRLDDFDIVRQILEGEVNAFEELLDRYRDHVLKILKKHVPYNEVGETAQEVFIRAYRSLHGFERRGSFKQWLSAIAVRTCCDFWRKQYRSREVPMNELSERHREWLEQALYDMSGDLHQEDGMREEAREILDWALDQLSPEDRTVLELVYLEGLSGKEAASLLGWSVANVKVRSYRSRKKLEKLLGKSSNRGRQR